MTEGFKLETVFYCLAKIKKNSEMRTIESNLENILVGDCN